MAQVDELVALLEQRAGVVAGRGPAHPAYPNPERRAELDEFLSGHPAIRSDSEYVEFLERYAGAYGEGAGWIVDVFGFGGTATDLIDPEYSTVTEDGFLIFAQCIHSRIADGKLVDSWEHDFAFSVAGERPGGVYVASTTLRTPSQPFAYYVDGFTQWMREAVEVGGRFGRPEVP